MKKILMMLLLAGSTSALMAADITEENVTEPNENFIYLEHYMKDDPDDNPQLFRPSVPYCDADQDVCMGTCDVYMGDKSKWVKVKEKGYTTYMWYVVTIYLQKPGYNCRFWSTRKNCYYYLQIDGKY